MKYNKLFPFSFLVVLLVSCAGTKHAQKMTLSWEENFNQPGGFDTSRWSKIPRGLSDWDRHMSDFDSCYAMRDGKLVLRGIMNNSVPGDTARYITGGVYTKDKVAFGSGRLEIRAKLNGARGAWPAFWLLPQGMGWPDGGEIDIMEYYRDTLLANILCGGKNHSNEWHTTKTGVQQLGGTAWAAKFHTWRMDWTPEYVALYIDDSLLNKMAVDALVNKNGTGFNPFKQPHYMLLNVAIGGQNGGDPAQTSFPRKMEVDYVRVWQEK